MEAERTNRGAASGRRHRLRRAFSRVVHVYRRRWFHVVAAGVFFIALMEASYLAFPNPNIVPAMIVYGAFLVPITFLIHLDGRLEAGELPLAVIVVLFISAGAVGVAIASTVESAFFPKLGFFQYAAVGPVEETAKMVVPLVFFVLGRYRSVGAGVMIGLVSAMAFSALETSGYGFNAFLGTLTGDKTARVADLFKSPLNILELDANIVFRSLLDPLGHGTWTMLVCFVLWNERHRAGRFVLNWRVLAAFVLAMLLHSSWDTTLSVPADPLWGRVLAWVAFAVTAGFTLWLLKRIVRKTREAMGAEPPTGQAGAASGSSPEPG